MNRLITIYLLLLTNLSLAQVGKVKERAESFKFSGNDDNDQSISWGSSDDDDNDLLAAIFIEVGWELIQLPFKGLHYWQKDHLGMAKADRWRISAELQAPIGVDPSRETFLINPNLRLNWGLFSTQVRYNRLFDATGTLTTLDWQVLQFNIFNNKDFRLLYGMGLSREIETEQSHFESLVEVDFHLLKRRLVPSCIFRWSGDGFPRHEITSSVSYNINPERTLSNTVSLGYTFQDWYDVPFHFITLGVGIILQ